MGLVYANRPRKNANPSSASASWLAASGRQIELVARESEIEKLTDDITRMGREQKEATAMLMGRASYEAFSPVWPDMEDFADYKVMPKYVVSTTLTEDDLVPNWGETTILHSLDEVATLKETEGGPIIVHGSAALN